MLLLLSWRETQTRVGSFDADWRIGDDCSAVSGLARALGPAGCGEYVIGRTHAASRNACTASRSQPTQIGTAAVRGVQDHLQSDRSDEVIEDAHVWDRLWYLSVEQRLRGN